MAKNYSENTTKYQAQNGLVRYYYREPNGEYKMKLLTEKQVKDRGLLVTKEKVAV